MVREDGEEGCCREGGEGARIAEPGWDLDWHERPGEEGEEHGYVGWAEELGEVEGEVLVVRVEAMCCQVGLVAVVEEVVEGGYDGVAEDGEEGCAGVVEGCVDVDCYEGEEQGEAEDGEEGCWSVAGEYEFGLVWMGHSLFLKVGQQLQTWKQQESRKSNAIKDSHHRDEREYRVGEERRLLLYSSVS